MLGLFCPSDTFAHWITYIGQPKKEKKTITSEPRLQVFPFKYMAETSGMLLMAMIYFGAGRRGCGVDREGGYDVKLRTDGGFYHQICNMGYGYK